MEKVEYSIIPFFGLRISTYKGHIIKKNPEALN